MWTEHCKFVHSSIGDAHAERSSLMLSLNTLPSVLPTAVIARASWFVSIAWYSETRICDETDVLWHSRRPRFSGISLFLFKDGGMVLVLTLDYVVHTDSSMCTRGRALGHMILLQVADRQIAAIILLAMNKERSYSLPKQIWTSRSSVQDWGFVSSTLWQNMKNSKSMLCWFCSRLPKTADLVVVTFSSQLLVANGYRSSTMVYHNSTWPIVVKWIKRTSITQETSKVRILEAPVTLVLEGSSLSPGSLPNVTQWYLLQILVTPSFKVKVADSHSHSRSGPCCVLYIPVPLHSNIQRVIQTFRTFYAKLVKSWCVKLLDRSHLRWMRFGRLACFAVPYCFTFFY